jgi:RHS repeat-associated protein
VAITDFAGKVKERIEYSSYGRITQRTGSTTDTPFLFGGEAGVETDANGLYYMHARYYNPHLRRFINADPAGLAGGMNFYAYADGDPISMIDPSGLVATSADRNDQIRNDFMAAYTLKQAETAAIWYTGVQGGSAPPMTGRQMLDTALSFTPGGDAVKALYTQYTYKELGTGAWSQRTDSEIFWQGIEGVASLAPTFPAAGKALGAVRVPTQPLRLGGKVAARATEGIYEFKAASGLTYVGQSSDIPRRLKQHEASGKLLPGTSVKTTEVLGGKTAREIAEQLRIKKLGGIRKSSGARNLENKVNPIGPKRQHLLPP